MQTYGRDIRGTTRGVLFNAIMMATKESIERF